MADHLVADAPKYRIELAKTGRSKCKTSKQPIEQGELRFGAYADMMGHGTYCWRKLNCITSRLARNVEAKVGSFENIDGFDALDADQQKRFKDAMEMARSGVGVGKSSKAKAKAGRLAEAVKSDCRDEQDGSEERPEEPEEIEAMLPFLVKLGIPAHSAPAYVAKLTENGFDCTEAVLTLTSDDLEGMGVLTGHQRLILHYVSSVQRARKRSREPEEKRCEASTHVQPSSEIEERGESSFLQRSTAARRWKQTQEKNPGAADMVNKLRRSRSRRLADEMGLDLERVRGLLRENDAAEARNVNAG
eukprot:TRINITY_DN30568_c0_g1_i1.p1 TRINITY_DN30568_c0_g1~~TRINITY_DN30568_c0_g1_i1.p1  ORF type:complete len:304 (-),score=55.01 TRINITY_DN30568_c0_g1_i1:402-1313(-)